MRYLNESELGIATRFLFLSMAITVLEKDLEHIQNGAFKIKEPYLDFIGKMLVVAKNDRRELRRKMYNQQIKITPLNHNESFTSYLIIAGKREEQRNYFNPAIRKHVQAILKELMTTTPESGQIVAAESGGAYQANNGNEPCAAPDS